MFHFAQSIVSKQNLKIILQEKYICLVSFASNVSQLKMIASISLSPMYRQVSINVLRNEQTFENLSPIHGLVYMTYDLTSLV